MVSINQLGDEIAKQVRPVSELHKTGATEYGFTEAVWSIYHMLNLAREVIEEVKNEERDWNCDVTEFQLFLTNLPNEFHNGMPFECGMGGLRISVDDFKKQFKWFLVEGRYMMAEEPEEETTD